MPEFIETPRLGQWGQTASLDSPRLGQWTYARLESPRLGQWDYAQTSQSPRLGQWTAVSEAFASIFLHP